MSSDPKEWIAVSMLPGLGPATLSKLTAQGISPTQILELDIPERLPLRADTYRALNPKTIHQLLNRAEALIEDATQKGLQCICQSCDAYPPLLKEIPDPPAVLWCKGQVNLLAQPQIAIVGSRKPSPAGEKTAYNFAFSLSKSGFVITSGLAQGVDTEAHKGAIRGLQTIAVLGASPENIYPRVNLRLAEQIVCKGGLLISEFPPGTKPRPEHFPRRNRIISGLSLGTLVVEAALKSGSLITARLAMEQGREVYAIPGSIHHSLAKGCHALIREGATLVETQQQIIEPLAPLLGYLAHQMELTSDKSDSRIPIEKELTEPSKGLLDRIRQTSITLDQLYIETAIPISELQQLLINLQLDGKIDRYGDRFIAIE